MIVTDHFQRSSEAVLRGIFAQFGLVQTCIVNVDKRHAFVKMLTRADAMQAKDGMERYKSQEMQLRVSPDEPVLWNLLTIFHRLGGALGLGLATAATIRLASVSFPSTDSPTPIVNGC